MIAAPELLEPIFPDATYTLETVDTVYIQGRTTVVRCLRVPALLSRVLLIPWNESAQPR